MHALHAVATAPAPVVQSCSLVDVVNTNLAADDAAAVLRLYREMADLHGPKPEPIARKLMEARGGFWDVYMIGSAFSYSVTCSELVELASSEWNVILCREAADADAKRCGSGGLTRYANGTLDLVHGVRVTSRDDDGAGSPRAFALNAAFHLDSYYNYLVDDVAAARAARAPVVQSLLERMLQANALHTPSAADELRRRLWPDEGTSWNVLVEIAAGGHFYFSEEQFNFELRGGGDAAPSAPLYAPLSVAIFDRRCDTLEREAREEHDAAARGGVGEAGTAAPPERTQALRASTREFGE